MFYTLHGQDNGKIVSVKVGDRIVVSLAEQPNSQNKWIWTHTPAITLVDESKKTEKSLEMRVFRFGVNSAAQDITLNLENPYVEGSIVDTFKFSIAIV